MMYEEMKKIKIWTISNYNSSAKNKIEINKNVFKTFQLTKREENWIKLLRTASAINQFLQF